MSASSTAQLSASVSLAPRFGNVWWRTAGNPIRRHSHIIAYFIYAISRRSVPGRRTRRLLRRRSHANPDRCCVLRLGILNLLWFAGGAEGHFGGCGRDAGARRRPCPAAMVGALFLLCSSR